MSKCLNPDCLAVSLSQDKYCTKCRSKLLLKERYRALKIIGQGGFGRTFLAIDEDKPSKPNCVIKQFLPQAQGTSNLEKASSQAQETTGRMPVPLSVTVKQASSLSSSQAQQTVS